jgi:hypothetical protein
MVVPPGQVLDEARAAARAGDHPRALERYERFFDRALQYQSGNHNYYGVRLSFCLDEWARLGEQYPLALERLEAKTAEAQASFEATCDDHKFHDFQAICSYLGRKELVMSEFVRYHHSKPELAQAALRLMWNNLVEAGRWDICAPYLEDHSSRYLRALDKFDQAMEVCSDDPSLGGDDFASQIAGWYVRDAGNLLAALSRCGQPDAAERLEATIATDMQSRGCPELVARVNEWAAR